MNGPVLFGGYDFQESSDYTPVAAGSYDLEGDPLQTFDVEHEQSETFSIIELDILSNHGNT